MLFMLPIVKDRDGVGVIQLADQARFLSKALPSTLRVFLGIEQLDRHGAIHLGVLGQKYGGATATTNHLLNAVLTGNGPV